MSFTDLINTLHTAPKLLDTIGNTVFICLIVSLILTVILLFTEKKILSSCCFLIFIISMITAPAIGIYINYQQDKHADEYTLAKDDDYFYVNSHTDYLESAKFKILGQNKDYIYVQKDHDTYNIPKIQERKAQ